MTTTSISAAATAGRLRHLLSAAWGAVSGIAPHVLHHVGPLAGAAILAGTGGKVLFFLLGLALATPMLVRLHRRFRTWIAPAIAVAIFVVTYTLSSIFIGPLITGTNDSSDLSPPPATATTDQHGHAITP
jgi:hypothetical protein